MLAKASAGWKSHTTPCQHHVKKQVLVDFPENRNLSSSHIILLHHSIFHHCSWQCRACRDTVHFVKSWAMVLDRGFFVGGRGGGRGGGVIAPEMVPHLEGSGRDGPECCLGGATGLVCRGNQCLEPLCYMFPTFTGVISTFLGLCCLHRNCSNWRVCLAQMLTITVGSAMGCSATETYRDPQGDPEGPLIPEHQ